MYAGSEGNKVGFSTLSTFVIATIIFTQVYFREVRFCHKNQSNYVHKSPNFKRGKFLKLFTKNAPKCTILHLKLKIFGGGACPQTPLETLRAYGARDTFIRALHAQPPEK